MDLTKKCVRFALVSGYGCHARVGEMCASPLNTCEHDHKPQPDELEMKQVIRDTLKDTAEQTKDIQPIDWCEKCVLDHPQAKRPLTSIQINGLLRCIHDARHMGYKVDENLQDAESLLEGYIK